MSATETTAAPSAALDTTVSCTELDVSKLHALPSEQQELYLLTFTADLVQYTATLDKTGLISQQRFIIQELFKILKLSSPSPTRVIRNNVGRCFSAIFSKGDRSTLYDTVTQLLGILNAGKNDAELKTKYAAAVAIGDIYTGAGDSLFTQSNVVCSALLKLFKSAQNHAGLRSSLYTALKKVIAGIGSPLIESTAKDIWKHSRHAATNDKAIAVQAGACYCLEQLIKTTPYFGTLSDFEGLKVTIWKVIESPSPSVRHAAASCLAAFLIKAWAHGRQTQNVPTIRRPKKQPKKKPTSADNDEAPERSQSPSSRKADVHVSFQLSDLLKQLSTQYCRSSTGNRARAGIAVCYKQILRNIGDNLVEEHYTEIAGHFLVTLLNHPTINYNRYRLLMTSKYVKNLLEDTVGREILRENSQLNAAKWLINGVLKDYPQVVQERPEPSKHTLIGALSALSSIISSLGSALSVIGDSCRDALLQVLQHPGYTVQIHTTQCLRNFVLACPQQLLLCVTVCMNSLNRELGQLSTPRQSTRRCLGYAHGLAAMLSTSRLQPLYGSVDVYAQVLSRATDLLKSSGSSELRIASTQIQIAWVLIGGLMPLGPSFTKIHLNQLLLLWKNALPKPLPKDNLAQRGTLEMSFLAHVRECALSSIYVFLEFNSKLVTADGSRRIATMLQNTVMFLDSLPKLKSAEDISQRLSPSLQLKDFATMIRRRVLQCFSKLINLEHANPEVLSLSNILGLAISSFADPDVISANPFDTSIAASTAHFDNLWDLDDNFGFGVTGLAHEFAVATLSGHHKGDNSHGWMAMESSDQTIDNLLMSPTCQAMEHDSVLLYAVTDRKNGMYTDPPDTEVVNAAIALFATALPLQSPKVQESSLEQIAALLSAQSLNRNPGRKSAMTVNIAIALLFTLKVALNETRSAPGSLKYPATEKVMQELIQTFTTHPDPIVRCIGCEALGRLCNLSGNSFTSNQINSLVDSIVENRDPGTRAGCAIALGCIHSQVGGIAAGFHLQTIVGVLMSLCSDPHPVVHFWALEGLGKVAWSAGLTFSAYVSSSLGMLARLYISDSHNEEASSLATSNLEVAFPSTVAIGRCVESLINVLGPDLRDISKTRELVFTLVKEFQLEKSTALIAESSKCLDHLSLYAPNHMDFSAYVRWLQLELGSKNALIRDAAIRGFNNLMKRDADLVTRTASPGLEDELWLAFDNASDSEVLKNIIRNWLQQTGLTDTDNWIQRCQKVLMKTRSKVDDAPAPTTVNTAAPHDIPDDEVAGFATAVVGDHGEPVNKSTAGQELLKWQTRSFVMSCLSELLSMVSKKLLPDQTIPAEMALQERIGDIIRMAFSASTAQVIELRIWGLKVIDQVLKMFGKTPDPDFSEVSLLEQYQAQISSALTPAFAADSSCELASEAINVCATFVGTGIVTNVDRMGRIFKLLVVGLENFAKKSEIREIGDLKGLNSNARVMVKLALFSAWARLQIASNDQNYLAEIVQPFTAILTPLWLSSLQEFARLRFEPEISIALGPSASDNLDDVYASLNRETLLKFYQDSWLNLVDAIASLVEKDSEFVFDALDGKIESPKEVTDADKPQVNGEKKGKGNHINYRDEPVAFFFVLFGLAFEALVAQSNSHSNQRLEILRALQKILHPSVAGNAVYQDAVFSETMDTLDRLAMTEGFSIQTVIVQIARNLALHHQSASSNEARPENLSDDIEQLFELTRNIILVLAGLLPNLGESSKPSRFHVSDDAASLIKLSLSSLVDITYVFPSIIRSDLRACILHIFTTILATGICQAEVVPQALPIFHRFIQGISCPPPPNTSPIPTTPALSMHPPPSEDPQIVSRQIRGCISCLLQTLTIAQRRESETSLPCAKNTLLSLTIILTTSSHQIPPQDPLIPRVLSEFLDCLQDFGLATVAAGCLRSILLSPQAPTPRSATDDAIARFLLPRLIAFITSMPASAGSEHEIPVDPENVKGVVTLALVSCIGSGTIAPGGVPTALALIIPALLVRAKNEGKGAYKEIAARLLELAKIHAVTFRAVVAGMDAERRSFTEDILRSGGIVGDGGREGRGGTAAGVEGEEKNVPSIALRMDF
ncbi:uncharacterized protein PADG_04770 [Paracoccidioides brasiliensis Pb18]|uniref:LAA1-like C-terminal TPR repeats domain-containing protein n=1 Tax=Paracoccidioides brasiliensis (strain Pb18) TaxID=502780 RepID=C1GCP8_PARBD|nr:uncharacterized protein PADG_04770 [Paracoccidioides brasiliensis Pb18]EEH48691.2 hypothetical protein PADG_04770 [Paracoccidioides brasiliensis Pb18]